MTLGELIEKLQEIENDYGTEISVMFDSELYSSMIADVTLDYNAPDGYFFVVLHEEKE